MRTRAGVRRRAQTVYTSEFMTNASVLRGCVLLQDSPSDAIAAFDDALRRIPGQGRAHLGLGLAYRAIGRDDEATMEFERAGDRHRRPGRDGTPV